jgi:hypothetical protein
MQKSETIGELAKALAVAQGEIQNAKKDSENPFFKSKYADLAAVRDACQGPFSKNGLAVIQTPKSVITEDATIIGLETLLCHSSGEWVSEELSAVPVKTDPQGIGSCITYLRRYALASFAGVAAEDDDGNEASHPAQQPARQAKPTQKSAEITELKKAVVDVCQMLNAAGDTPKWSAKRVDEFAVSNFGMKADALELEPMREMVKRLSLRLDELKKQPAKAKQLDGGTQVGHAEEERQKLIAEISKSAKADVLSAYLHDHFDNRALQSLSLDALIQMHEEFTVPF